MWRRLWRHQMSDRCSPRLIASRIGGFASAPISKAMCWPVAPFAWIVLLPLRLLLNLALLHGSIMPVFPFPIPVLLLHYLGTATGLGRRHRWATIRCSLHIATGTALTYDARPPLAQIVKKVTAKN